MCTYFSTGILMIPTYGYYTQSLCHTQFSKSVTTKQNKYETPKTKGMD